MVGINLEVGLKRKAEEALLKISLRERAMEIFLEEKVLISLCPMRIQNLIKWWWWWLV